jgi:hypothetical protein
VTRRARPLAFFVIAFEVMSVPAMRTRRDGCAWAGADQVIE